MVCGSTECKVPSCMNRAKSRGFCWSHGGGTKCKEEKCEKIAISNGLCWAHGGGKRCAVEGCMRQAYERTDNLCNNHFQERQHSATAATEGETANWHPDDEEKPPPMDQ
ncbi:putative WRKY transcription factor 19 [Phytophthora citrophthora]|uniref:WRKY transcription factor 19 n=1 Tax=Phytophthora citrophthora TaxID=4793 RepID=A0AAD9LEU7_9STRA|nr:putative WRKY transcription factor 19 [Phytophthora citrophthora]